MRSARWSAALGLGACLALGCGEVPLADRFAGYEREVAAALGKPAPPSSAPSDLPALPRRRLRLLQAPERRIGMFDFVALQGCRLGVLVGERNSQLGRVMRPVNRLAYELELLREADACVASLDGERAARLVGMLGEKRAELPIHTWNAVWSSEPMERYLGRTAGPILGSPDDDEVASLIAIRAVLAEPEGRDAAKILGSALADLRDEPPLGAALRTLVRVARHLDAVALQLEGFDPGTDRCPNSARRLTRLFRERYLPLQTLLAHLDRRAAAVLPELDAIYRLSAAPLPDAPAAMGHYHAAVLDTDAAMGLWQRHRGALRRHADAWAPTLVACDVLPPVDEAP